MLVLLAALVVAAPCPNNTCPSDPPHTINAPILKGIEDGCWYDVTDYGLVEHCQPKSNTKLRGGVD